MRLLRGFQQIKAFENGTVATIGNFDGVHIGHQALISALRNEAALLKLPMLLILFEPQPGEYFNSKSVPARLTSLREKLNALRRMGLEYVYCFKFDVVLADMSATQFAENFIFSFLHVKSLFVGQDFRFGRKRSGDIHLLQKIAGQCNSKIQLFSDYSIDNERVSSTNVRQALHLGELNRAAKLLGRKFSLCGRVIQGEGRGREWGIPTANLNLHRITLPLKGVFCVQVKRLGVKPLLNGVANIGSRPTVDGSKNILEIHLFEFDESIYGELLQVYFLHKLRDEVKFSSVDSLIAQIHIDISQAKSYFYSYQS